MDTKPETLDIRKTACGSKLKDSEDLPSAIYHSKRVYFCNLACLRAFENSPDPFMAGKIEHPCEEDISQA